MAFSSRPVRRAWPAASGQAPETFPHVVQADGFVQGTWRSAGETVHYSTVAARYLVSHGVLKTKEQHEADKAAAEAADASFAGSGYDDAGYYGPADDEAPSDVEDDTNG